MLIFQGVPLVDGLNLPGAGRAKIRRAGHTMRRQV